MRAPDIVGMQKVVERTGMLRVRGQHAFKQRSDPILQVAAGETVRARITRPDEAARSAPQQRQRVQRDDIGIARKVRGDTRHRFAIAALPIRRVAVAEQDLHRSKFFVPVLPAAAARAAGVGASARVLAARRRRSRYARAFDSRSWPLPNTP